MISDQLFHSVAHVAGGPTVKSLASGVDAEDARGRWNMMSSKLRAQTELLDGLACFMGVDYVANADPPGDAELFPLAEQTPYSSHADQHLPPVAGSVARGAAGL